MGLSDIILAVILGLLSWSLSAQEGQHSQAGAQSSRVITVIGSQGCRRVTGKTKGKRRRRYETIRVYLVRFIRHPIVILPFALLLCRLSLVVIHIVFHVFLFVLSSFHSYICMGCLCSRMVAALK